MRVHRVATGAALLLAACGGGDYGDEFGGGGSAVCSFITGGNSSVSSSGPVSNAHAAADGDLYSYATFNINTASQSASIRAHAQNGVVFPAGSRAGAFMTFQNQQGSNITVIRTFFHGIQQETSNGPDVIFEPVGSGSGADFYFGFVTTRMFDAVEVSESDNSAAPVYRVYEICSDGHT